jgi:NAD(P)-dependent dehydrogenase (short-subunit alcohol dehydrogenase family)
MSARVAMVTGANGGLGRHVTQALLDAEFTVVGVSPGIRQEMFDHPRFSALAADLNRAAAANQAATAVLAQFGRIDLLAHLAGGFAGGADIAQTDDATWERMFALNLLSAFHIFRAVLPPMRQAGSGRIIAMGSRAAESPGAKVGAYSASKAALVSLVRTVAMENKDAGITANAILPGTIDTPANRAAMPGADTREWVDPASIASLILWLGGDAGKDVTGAAIPVYGRGL